MRRGRVLLLAGLSCALLVSGAGLAEAKPVDTSRRADAPATAVLQKPSSGAGVLTHCYGQTDQPHLSTHQPGTVNVVARTVCRGSTEWVYVYTELYRDRWWGEQFLDSGENSGYGSTSTNASWYCRGSGTYTYRAYSYHDSASSVPTRTYNYRRLTC